MADSAAVQTCSGGCPAAQRKLGDLKTWRDDADVAVAAYGKPPPSRIGNKSLVTDPAELAKAGLTPEDLKIPGSNFAAVVYKEGEPPAYTVGFKGTEEWTGSDMKANIEQALDRRTNGAPNAYYSRAQQIARQMELAQKRAGTGAAPPKFVGHSLGGGLASAAASAVGGPATTFNAAGLNRATVTGAPDGGDVTAIHVKGEALTRLQQLSPLPNAHGRRTVPLDPPFNLTRDFLAMVGGALVGGTLGLAAAVGVRAGLLHKMGNVIDSLDSAITNAAADVKEKCG